jgi:hypothetical protein
VLLAIHSRLTGRERVEGLADLDIEPMLERLQQVFPAAVREPNADAD